MREMFVGSGLFSWKPMSFNAKRGDIYLDEENHTAMCIRNGGTADLLGEFSISETGGIDGEPGDQTGRESWVHDYYSGHWDGILHYNGKADGPLRRVVPALVRHPTTCQSLRRGSSPEISALAMRAGPRWATATTRCRRR